LLKNLNPSREIRSTFDPSPSFDKHQVVLSSLEGWLHRLWSPQQRLGYQLYLYWLGHFPSQAWFAVNHVLQTSPFLLLVDPFVELRAASESWWSESLPVGVPIA